MSNRLLNATSPYLLQHAQNPVDWWEWGDDAFAEARRRDVPVLLSIGYASCHWCHVMAHESFEDAELAAQINADFVAVKVDREERPDIDAVYLAATRSMTGSAGWPLTCILTPTGDPFFCGTYFPPEPRPGQPGLRQVLTAATRAWTQNGDRVRGTAAQIAASLARAPQAALDEPLDAMALDAAAERLSGLFDEEHGGFGPAPKFPAALAMEFLLRHHERTGSPRSLEMVRITAERMARGGIFDQLAGGFARYTLDATWIVPHFEKMLYDNALLLRVYAHLARRTGSELAWRVVDETATFLLEEMTTPEGAFAAGLDADIDGVEGGAYLWSRAQLEDALDPADAEWAAALLTVPEAGTFENADSTPQLLTDPDDPARWRRVRATLHDARARRPRPARDDKVVTAWNGLMIAALAEAGAVAGRPELVAAAERAAELVLDVHLVDGRLRRSSRAGRVGAAAAVLEDYACFADALLCLHEVTGVRRWLDAATGLLDTALTRFADPEERPGVFFDVADDAETLLVRPRETTDGTTPSGSSALATALLTAAVLVDPALADRFGSAAAAAISAGATDAVRQPQFAGQWLAAAEARLAGPLQVAVVGDGEAARELEEAARRLIPGGGVVVSGAEASDQAPLLAGRPLLGGAAAAYVCHGYVCDRPVSTVPELAALLET